MEDVTINNTEIITEDWKDIPENSGYYYVVIKGEESYYLVYVDTKNQQYIKTRLNSFAYSHEYQSKLISEVTAKWLFIDPPLLNDISLLHKKFDREGKVKKLELLLAETEKLKK